MVVSLNRFLAFQGWADCRVKTRASSASFRRTEEGADAHGIRPPDRGCSEKGKYGWRC